MWELHSSKSKMHDYMSSMLTLSFLKWHYNFLSVNPLSFRFVCLFAWLFGCLFVCRFEHQLKRDFMFVVLSFFSCYFLSVCSWTILTSSIYSFHVHHITGFCFLRTIIISTYWFFDTDEKRTELNNTLHELHALHTFIGDISARDLRIVHRSSNSWLLLWVASMLSIQRRFFSEYIVYVYAVSIGVRDLHARFTIYSLIHSLTHSHTLTHSISHSIHMFAGSLQFVCPLVHRFVFNRNCCFHYVIVTTLTLRVFIHILLLLHTFTCVCDSVSVCFCLILSESLCFVLSCYWHCCCYFGWFLFSLFEFSHFISFSYSHSLLFVCAMQCTPKIESNRATHIHTYRHYTYDTCMMYRAHNHTPP